MTIIIKNGVQMNLNDFPALFPNRTGVKFADEGWSVVFPAPQGALSNPVTKRWQEGAPVLTGLGTWQQTWTEVDVYADYTDEQSVLHTKAEQEAAAIAANLATAKAALIIQIDADADALIRAVIGERASEYELAEKEATAYKAAGYPATVSSSVSAWATAKGWTATAAADDIIAASTNWRSAQAAMRAARLLRKEQARNAVDATALDAAKAQWATFIAALRVSLGA